MEMYLSLMFVCFVLVLYGKCQDCRVGGKPCGHHEQCCGGCCFNSECIDTYRSCLKDLNVCKGHVCRGEENCVAYKPRRCNGCEPVPLCRITKETVLYW